MLNLTLQASEGINLLQLKKEGRNTDWGRTNILHSDLQVDDHDKGISYCVWVGGDSDSL